MWFARRWFTVLLWLLLHVTPGCLWIAAFDGAVRYLVVTLAFAVWVLATVWSVNAVKRELELEPIRDKLLRSIIIGLLVMLILLKFGFVFAKLLRKSSQSQESYVVFSVVALLWTIGLIIHYLLYPSPLLNSTLTQSIDRSAVIYRRELGTVQRDLNQTKTKLRDAEVRNLGLRHQVDGLRGVQGRNTQLQGIIQDLTSSPERRSATLGPPEICVICQERAGDKVTNCGHMFCSACLDSLPNSNCPLCRRAITGVQDLRVVSV